MLARMRKRIDEKEEGFTLIELLVVIIIIGILAAIAIPVFLSQKSKGYEASMKSDLRTIAQDIESANVDGQDYTAIKWKTTAITLGTADKTTASADTITSAATGIVGGDTVKLSNGNVAVVSTASASAFCIKMTSTKATSATWYYSTAQGGIATSC
jgi:type IV pilus assembly protein PilA